MGNIDYNTAIQNAKNALKNLPKEVLQARPDLLTSANKIVDAVKKGDENTLNEFIKANASHIK
jgi:hypothetical protein